MKTAREMISKKSMDFSPAGRRMVEELMKEYAKQTAEQVLKDVAVRLNANSDKEYGLLLDGYHIITGIPITMP